MIMLMFLFTFIVLAIQMLAVVMPIWFLWAWATTREPLSDDAQTREAQRRKKSRIWQTGAWLAVAVVVAAFFWSWNDFFSHFQN